MGWINTMGFFGLSPQWAFSAGSLVRIRTTGVPVHFDGGNGIYFRSRHFPLMKNGMVTSFTFLHPQQISKALPQLGQTIIGSTVHPIRSCPHLIFPIPLRCE
jgi:hypothetical protein